MIDSEDSDGHFLAHKNYMLKKIENQKKKIL